MLEAGAELLHLTPPSPLLSLCYFLLFPFSLPSFPLSGSSPLPPSPTCSLSAEAAPTDSEKEVHTKVAQVLVKAPEILQELRSYKGAGELIREVGVALSVLQGGRGTN